MQLGSGVAVAVPQPCSCSYDLTSPGTSICQRYGCKKKKKKDSIQIFLEDLSMMEMSFLL